MEKFGYKMNIPNSQHWRQILSPRLGDKIDSGTGLRIKVDSVSGIGLPLVRVLESA